MVPSLRVARPLAALIVVLGLITVLLTATPADASGTIAFVQTAQGSVDSTSTTQSVTFSGSNAAGNLIVVAVSWATNSSLTCSDTRSNSYTTAIVQYDADHTQAMGVCYAANVSTGSNTVTATFGSSSSYRRMILNEYSGAATTSPLDVKTGTINYATYGTFSASSTAITPNYHGDLLFGAVIDDQQNSNISAGSGFTKRNSTNAEQLATEDLTQTGASTDDTSFTFSAPDGYIAQALFFKPAGAVAASTPLPDAHYVQTTGYTGPSSATSVSSTFANSTVVGNTVVATVVYGGSSGTLTCSDTQGNPYTTVMYRWSASQPEGMGTCYATNVSSAPDTISASFGGGSKPYRAMTITEYSGILVAAPVDTSTSNDATSTTATDNANTTSLSTSGADELIYGSVLSITGTPVVAAGTGFNSRGTYASGSLVTEDKVAHASGSVSATWTFSSGETYLADLIAFRPASLGSSVAVSVAVDPSFVFAVTSQPAGTICNGLPASTVDTTTSAVSFGHLVSGARALAVQRLDLSTNAASGYVVTLRSPAASSPVLSSSAGRTIADSGSVTLPVAGNAFFGYTSDNTAAAMSTGYINSVPNSSSTAVVGNGPLGSSQNCVAYAVGTSLATAADTYQATVVYTAIPTF